MSSPALAHFTPLHGLVAATHTPFDPAGDLDLPAVDRQAEHLFRAGVKAVFVGGTTGESASLQLTERLALARRWAQVVRGTSLRLVVHVGANCLADARALAADAQAIGAAAVSALSPSYFKPRSLDVLIACCADIALAAPALPFYFYDIPSLTGVNFSASDLLESGVAKMPNLAGVKFTNPDLAGYQRCLRAGGGRFDVPWGADEYMLSALALGATGAVGSTYNFAAPLYTRMIAAFERGDLAAARVDQYRSVQLVDLLAGYGYMAAAKATMGFLGVPVGQPRLPHVALTAAQTQELRKKLEASGFFEWGVN